MGDDWAEDHHDVELMDGSGRRLATARLPEGVAGMARLHAMIGHQVGRAEDADVEVVIGIETDRGPWVAALVAAGYTVLPVNPLQAAEVRRWLCVISPARAPARGAGGGGGGVGGGGWGGAPPQKSRGWGAPPAIPNGC